MGRTVWNPVLVSIAAAPSFAWELLEQIQQQLQPTPLSFCFSLPPSSCVYHSVITHSPSNCLFFLFVIFQYFSFLISWASSSSFPFCCRSVVLRPFLGVSWHPHVMIFFLLLFYFPHCCVFHITIHILYYSVSFLPWKWWQENGGFTSGRVLFLDQILHSHNPVLRERESLPALLTSRNKTHILEHVYKPLFSLCVCECVSLAFGSLCRVRCNWKVAMLHT